MVSKVFQASLLLAGAAPSLAAPFALFARQSNSTGSGSGSGSSVDELVGFGAGTTGASTGSGSGTTVSSCSDLETALEAGGYITIDGMLDGCDVLKVPSDTTLIGTGSKSGFTNSGLRVKDANNVIIRNLIFDTPPESKDLIEIDASTNIWVDHCEFSTVGLTGDKDTYDGMLDIKHGSDMVTVSWNKFKDHWKASLVGHSDNNADEDTGKLHVTYHHNSWTNINSRTPSIRFGTAHIFSSCYTDIPTSGIHSRMGAQVLAEENYFSNVENALVTDLDSDEDGFITSLENVLKSSTTSITQEAALTPDYSYTTDAADSVCALIESSGGVGVIA